MGDKEGLDKQVNPAPGVNTQDETKPSPARPGAKPSEQVRSSPRVKPGSRAPAGGMSELQKMKAVRLAEMKAKKEKEKEDRTDNRLGTYRKPTGSN